MSNSWQNYGYIKSLNVCSVVHILSREGAIPGPVTLVVTFPLFRSIHLLTMS